MLIRKLQSINTLTTQYIEVSLINVQPIIGPGVFYPSIFIDREGPVLQSLKRLQLRIGQAAPDNISIPEGTFNKRMTFILT